MPKISISGNEEKVYTDELIISQNAVIYDTSFIPLYNISMVSVEEKLKESYHIWACGMLAAGIICLGVFARLADTGSVLTGLIWLVMGIILISKGFSDIGVTCQKNSEAGEYLVLNLNSGRSLLFCSRNHAFMMRVMDVIINCINNECEYVINLAHCNIQSCQFGDGDIMSRK